MAYTIKEFLRCPAVGSARCKNGGGTLPNSHLRSRRFIHCMGKCRSVRVPCQPVTLRLPCGCSCCLSRPRHGGHSKRKRHTMTTKTLSKKDLAQFTGSENWYRHGINRNVLHTDGVQHVAEHGGAYWLL